MVPFRRGDEEVEEGRRPGFILGLRLIEFVKGLCAENVLTECFVFAT